jgi:hypothetical protein
VRIGWPLSAPPPHPRESPGPSPRLLRHAHRRRRGARAAAGRPPHGPPAGVQLRRAARLCPTLRAPPALHRKPLSPPVDCAPLGPCPKPSTPTSTPCRCAAPSWWSATTKPRGWPPTPPAGLTPATSRRSTSWGSCASRTAGAPPAGGVEGGHWAQAGGRGCTAGAAPQGRGLQACARAHPRPSTLYLYPTAPFTPTARTSLSRAASGSAASHWRTRRSATQRSARAPGTHHLTRRAAHRFCPALRAPPSHTSNPEQPPAEARRVPAARQRACPPPSSPPPPPPAPRPPPPAPRPPPPAPRPRQVQEAAVIGVPHPKWDERPLLVVVPKPPAEPSNGLRREILDFMGSHPDVAKFAVPDDVLFVEAIPYGATGKVRAAPRRVGLSGSAGAASRAGRGGQGQGGGTGSFGEPARVLTSAPTPRSPPPPHPLRSPRSRCARWWPSYAASPASSSRAASCDTTGLLSAAAPLPEALAARSACAVYRCPYRWFRPYFQAPTPPNCCAQRSATRATPVPPCPLPLARPTTAVLPSGGAP